MSTLTVEHNTVTCHSCHKSIARRTAQPIRLLTPTGRYREGVEVLRAGETVYACEKCMSRAQ